MHANPGQYKSRLFSLLLLVVLFLTAIPSHAQFAGFSEQGAVSPELIASVKSVQPGKPFTVGVVFEIKDNWHLYWTNPEGDGFAPAVQWNLPEGYKVSAARWPAPHTFEFLGSVQFGYENKLTLLFDITPPADASGSADFEAMLTWLVCDDKNCVPSTGYPKPLSYTMTLPVSADATSASPYAEQIKSAEHAVPQTVEGWSFSAERAADGFVLRIQAPSEQAAQAMSGLYFFSDEKYAIAPEAEQPAQVDGKTVRLKLQQRETNSYGNPINRDKPITQLSGVLTAKSGFGEGGPHALAISATPVGKAAEGADSADAEVAPHSSAAPHDAAVGEVTLGFGLAMGLAFLGGLILNLMPCVFPVLSIKILGFVKQAGENPAIVRRHGYAFGAGVILSFWVLVGVLLTLREAAQAAAETTGVADSVTWGFQLQNPVFVLAMLILVFLIGLNLIGAFEVGLGLSAAAGKASQGTKDGYSKSFFTGVLATLIATPCTGPFMAPALGYAIAQPVFLAFLVFTALGIGMATPYVLLSCFPKLLNYLPRPGVWMESFKQAMAFPMFATAGWLAWVYISLVSDAFGLPLLVGLSVVAMGAWVYGRWAQPVRAPRTRWIARVAALVIVAGAAGYLYLSANSIEQQRIAAEEARAAGQYVYEWVAYSPEKVQELRASGRPVLVDFTASWCFICQTNKKTSLRTAAAQKLYEQYNVALFEADNTRTNPQIAKVLEEYKRAGVPLYLVFPAGDPDAPPQVLPEVLTPQIVRDAILTATDSQPGSDPSLTRR